MRDNIIAIAAAAILLVIIAVGAIARRLRRK